MESLLTIVREPILNTVHHYKGCEPTRRDWKRRCLINSVLDAAALADRHAAG